MPPPLKLILFLPILGLIFVPVTLKVPEYLLLELSQVPYFDDGIISSREQERVLPVPGDDVDITLVGVAGEHVCLVRGCPAVPNPNTPINRTRSKNLEQRGREPHSLEFCVSSLNTVLVCKEEFCIRSDDTNMKDEHLKA